MPGEPAKPVPRGFLSEYAFFLKRYKMWWLLPTAFILVVLVGSVLFSAGKGALEIYAVF